MNDSNVTLNNLSNNISQNLSFTINNLSDNKIETLNNYSNSSNLNLYPFINNYFPSILVITFTIPFGAIIYLKTKLSSLKNNPKTDEFDIQTARISISCITGWFLINIFIIFYFTILNPTLFSYNLVTVFASGSGFLLIMVTLVLIWIEDFASLIKEFYNFKSYMRSKFYNFKSYISSKFEKFFHF